MKDFVGKGITNPRFGDQKGAYGCTFPDGVRDGRFPEYLGKERNPCAGVVLGELTMTRFMQEGLEATRTDTTREELSMEYVVPRHFAEQRDNGPIHMRRHDPHSETRPSVPRIQQHGAASAVY